MSKSCTIYSTRDYQEILDHLGKQALREISESDDKSFEKLYDEGSIRISLKRQIEQGDGFSSLLRGTWNYVEKIETEQVKQKEVLANRILESKTAIGIVAEPDFNRDDTRLDLVFELAEMFDGIIFNGSAMLDKDGRVILDSDGASPV